KEKKWQTQLIGPASSKLSIVFDLPGSAGNSAITEQLEPLLREWYNTMQKLRDDWFEVATLPNGIKAEAWYLPHFHQFAFRGVVDILELMLKHPVKNFDGRLFTFTLDNSGNAVFEVWITTTDDGCSFRMGAQ
ncbi:hypothetical protein MPER_01329, partial [Moniliophthora perniciosa FA553]